MSRRFRQPGSKYTYGVLVGRITDGAENAQGKSPHYEILVDANGTPYRVAVNVQSVDQSEVLAYLDHNYTAETPIGLSALTAGAQGFQSLQQGHVTKGLDYIRDNLFPLDQMKPIPAAGSGTTLGSQLDELIQRAKRDGQAVAIAVGDEFDDSQTTEQLNFKLGRGVHDIHMMQGNAGEFAKDNRTHGDGALFIRFAGGETAALFIRFATQSMNTDANGNPK